MSPNTPLPANLETIVADFELMQGREKLELLLEYAQNFPPFPQELRANLSLEEVPECMSPVQMASEEKDGRLYFYFDIPPESPTVRGFAALMMAGINGSDPTSVLTLPADFYVRMGLQDVLTPQRLNGMAAILAHVKRFASESLTKPLDKK